MELDLQPGDVVKVLESAALGWVRARVIRVKSGGRVVVQSDQGREFTARGEPSTPNRTRRIPSLIQRDGDSNFSTCSLSELPT